MVVADVLHVWRFAGADNVVALMGETTSDRQEALITSFASTSQRVTLALILLRNRSWNFGDHYIVFTGLGVIHISNHRVETRFFYLKKVFAN